MGRMAKFYQKRGGGVKTDVAKRIMICAQNKSVRNLNFASKPLIFAPIIAILWQMFALIFANDYGIIRLVNPLVGG